MSFFSKIKQENGATDNGAPAAATFVVAGASGAAVPVTEPFLPAEVETLKEKTSFEVISDVAKARHRAGVA